MAVKLVLLTLVSLSLIILTFANKSKTLKPKRVHKELDYIISARDASHKKEAPILVAYNQYSTTADSSCSGSLISKSFVLTAAHCFQYLNERNPDYIQRCVDDTRLDGVYNGQKGGVKCYFVKNHNNDTTKHLEIHPTIGNKGKVWVGADNIEKLDETNVSSSLIKRVIFPEKSYRGGGYYEFGGYDIALIELDDPIENSYYACLPHSTYDDKIGSFIVAGYGKFFRTHCVTNKYGPAKYHPCKKDFKCQEKPRPHNHTECEVLLTKHPIRTGYHEAMIMQKNDTPIFCFKNYNQESKKFGWCETEGNYYDLQKPDLSYESWGFCSKDCNTDRSNQEANVLRIAENIHVLNQNLCEIFLNVSLKEHVTNVKVRPIILCIGRLIPLKVMVYEQEGKQYKRIKAKEAEKLLYVSHYISPALKKEVPMYVVSAGICQGDSGGPLFKKEKVDGSWKYTVTGVVSGGRRKKGDCGGINNPTHYVAIKHFGKWITEVLPKSEQLCWTPERANNASDHKNEEVPSESTTEAPENIVPPDFLLNALNITSSLFHNCILTGGEVEKCLRSTNFQNNDVNPKREENIPEESTSSTTKVSNDNETNPKDPSDGILEETGSSTFKTTEIQNNDIDSTPKEPIDEISKENSKSTTKSTIIQNNAKDSNRKENDDVSYASSSGTTNPVDSEWERELRDPLPKVTQMHNTKSSNEDTAEDEPSERRRCRYSSSICIVDE